MELNKMLNMPGAKIAIFRALQLGDMLCAIPAIRALRNTYPTTEIILVGMPWAKSFAGRFQIYIDRFISFPGWPGLPEQQCDPGDIVRFLQAMQSEKFDLILQMQGNGNIVNPMLELWGGKALGGFTLPQLYSPTDSSLFIEYPNHLHEIERHLALVKKVGVESYNQCMDFPLMDTDWRDFDNLHFDLPAGGYVCIHPGSRAFWRQWPTQYFASLGDYCVGQGMKVVLTGTQDELSIVTEVASLMHGEALILAGKTTLGAAALLIKFSFALISNCTGPSHLAAALKIPSVVISMDGEPERWAPLNQQLHRTVDWTKTPDYALVLSELAFIFSVYRRS